MTSTTGRPIPAWHLAALAAAATSLAAVAGWPARAEDSGFWDTIRAMSRESPSYAPSLFEAPRVRRLPPRVQRAARPKPQPPREQVARLPEQPAPILKAADPAERPNPLATLLSDPTLRKGDIVMFPEGARVFRGEQGTRHAMADFVELSKSRDVAQATRKVLAGLPVGDNTAWSSGAVAASGRLAQGAADVETTGSLPGRGRSRR